jgi:hypothetical protein
LSQIYKSSASGPVPPDVPTSFVTQDGTAVPTANILLVDGFDSTENNDNGIITKGGVAGTGTSNEVDIVLTNRITGSATTTDGTTPVNLYTFSLGATPGTYLFTTNVVGYDITDLKGAGYASYRCVRTTGAAGVLIDAQISSLSEETPFTDAEVSNNIVGNSVTVTVTGVTGKTIDWYVLTTYVFVS